MLFSGTGEPWGWQRVVVAPEDIAEVFKGWCNTHFALLAAWHSVYVKEQTASLESCIGEMDAALEGFEPKSSPAAAQAVNKYRQKSRRSGTREKANLVLLGCGDTMVADTEAKALQCNDMLAAWGMQTLMATENAMDKTKGIAVRARLREVYESHVKGKTCKHILADQIQEVEKILAIEDTPAEDTQDKPTAKRQKAMKGK